METSGYKDERIHMNNGLPRVRSEKTMQNTCVFMRLIGIDLDVPNRVDGFYLNSIDWADFLLSQFRVLCIFEMHNQALFCNMSFFADCHYYTAQKWSDDGGCIFIASTWDET